METLLSFFAPCLTSWTNAQQEQHLKDRKEAHGFKAGSTF